MGDSPGMMDSQASSGPLSAISDQHRYLKLVTIIFSLLFAVYKPPLLEKAFKAASVLDSWSLLFSVLNHRVAKNEERIGTVSIHSR